MTDLEDRLRAELAAFAQRADPALVRPLRKPAVRARPRVPGWLAPAAAAAAVAAVDRGVAFAGRPAGHRPATGPVAGVPRYYLTLDQPRSGHVARAVVHSLATGAALASARIPLQDGESPSVTGAADARTFIVVDNTRQAPGHGYGVRFYRLRVGPDGRTVRLDRLPIKVWPLAVDDVALSPDGSRLAIAEQSCRGNRCQYSRIQVRSLVTGATKTWRTGASGAPWHLSWAAGGHLVGFLWESGLHSPPATQRDGYRLLNVAGPAGDLLPAGAVAPVSPNPDGDIPPAFVTPDGRAFITSSTRIVPGRDHHVTVIAKIIKLSARTGRVQRVLYAASARGVPQTYGNAGTLDEQGCAVLSLDPAGQHPLVQCFLLGRFSFGTLASGHLKPLSGIPNIYCARECRGPTWGTAAW
jgi:hypothetical protein